MARRWSRAIVSLGVLGGGLLVAGCGGDSSDIGGLMPIFDAGQKDRTSSGGDDNADAFAGDDASASDATVGDATSAGDDAGGSDDSGDDGASAADAPADGNGGGGGDAGATPDGGAVQGDAGGSDGGDGGMATQGSDAGPDASTADAGSTSPDGGACDFAGTWGAEITIDVTWAAGGILDIVIAPGSGTIKQWLLSTRTQNGKTVTDTAVVCGIQLPDFQGNAELVNETYGIRFPNSLFDSGDLTPFAINGTVSGSTPTATYTTTPAAALLGLTLANPTTAVWPATITTEIDEDDDSKPGITANVVPPGGGYSYVPLDISVISFPTTVARADELYVVIRQVTSVSAQFSDCNHSSGSVTVPQITDTSSNTKKYAIDSHVIGCSVNGTGTDCSANQTTFVDENQPVFVPSATTFVSQRFPTGSTCANVRSALQ
jgi:hypothetical protein